MSENIENEIKLKGVDFDEKLPELEYETPIIPKRGRGRPKGSTKKKEQEQKRLESPTRFLEDLESKTDNKDTGDILDKLKLIRKITQYKALFPDDLKNIKTNNLENLNEEKLQEKLNSVQTLVESRKSLNSSRSLFLVGLNTFETYDYLFALKLKGLTYTASKSEDLMKTVDEVSLKYFDMLVQTDPVLRLIFGLGTLVFAIDNKNRNEEQKT